MKSFFYTLGWSTTYILSLIIRHGISTNDEIILILPKVRDEQAEKAILDVKSIASQLGTLSVKELTLDIKDIPRSVMMMIEELNRRKDKVCIVNLSGGMRILVIITYLACILSKNDNIIVEMETEDRELVTQLPLLKFKFEEFIPAMALEILRKSIEIGDSKGLREYFNLPPSTFHNYLILLEKAKLINRERKGKSYNIIPTQLGRIIATSS
ncbi:MAG: CRISPR-associated CARF protein Csa3 [Nitrososphaerales archaeon]